MLVNIYAYQAITAWIRSPGATSPEDVLPPSPPPDVRRHRDPPPPRAWPVSRVIWMGKPMENPWKTHQNP